MKTIKKYIVSWIMLLALFVTTGCGYMVYESYESAEVIGGQDGPTSIIVADSPSASSESEQLSSVVESVAESSVAESAAGSSASKSVAESSVAESVAESSTTESSTAESVAELLDPDGSYTTCEDVALYLETYGELPKNFMTKNEARKLGWEGGSLEPYAPGMCIGGDKFGNYEGNLPKAKGRTYRECDIDTLGAKSRGAKRIVFSNDGLIYYTDNHYKSFTLLYD